MADIILRNGLIVDGTGAAPFKGDIAMKDGVITAISKGEPLQMKGAEEVDATDRVVSPGWVDVHTHVDAQVTWDPLVSPLTSNGVTTAVMGNCGVGFAPCKKEQRGFLMELMEGVEDIPLGCMENGIEWNWETFPEFMDYLSGLELGCDVAAYIGHGAVRTFCLGKKANIPDRPGAFKDPSKQITPEEIQKMAQVVREAIEAGAIGFSTSRTLLHRDKSGVLVPGTLAAEEELLCIGKAVAEGGGGVFEMSSDFFSYDDAPHVPEDHVVRLEHYSREWIWIEQISKGFGLPVTVCLGIPSVLAEGVDSNGYRQMFKEVSSANSNGSNIKLQVFTRPQAIQMSWDSRSHPFVESQTYADLLRESIRSKSPMNKSAFLDPKIKAQILRETLEGMESGGESNATFGVVLPTSTDTEEDILIGNINGSVSGRGALARFYRDGGEYIFRWDKSYEPPKEASAATESQKTGKSILEVVYDWMCEQECSRVVSFIFMNYHKGSLDDTAEMLFNENSIPGLGDAGAHSGFIVDSTSHTYLLTHYVRDRKAVPIEYAVKRHTADTAHYFGLTDRGVLQVGKKADVNVINMNTLECQCPKFVQDLPKDGCRWVQHASGYDYTIVNGKIVFKDGQHTGLLPGRLVKNPNRGKGVPKDFKFGSLTGNMSMWFTSLRQETKHVAFKALLRVLGPERLTSLGTTMNASPLDSKISAKM